MDLARRVGLRGDYAEAERLLREALRRCQNINWVNSEQWFFVVKELANQRHLQSDPHEAIMLLTNAIPNATHFCGADGRVTLWMHRTLGRNLAEVGRFAEAEVVLRKALAALTAKTSDLQSIGRVRFLLGRVLVQQHNLDEAEQQLTEALKLIRESVVRGDSL